MQCQDCGHTVFGSDVELQAIRDGLTICEECIAAMEVESAAYDAIMDGISYECEFLKVVDEIAAGAARRRGVGRAVMPRSRRAPAG